MFPRNMGGFSRQLEHMQAKIEERARAKGEVKWVEGDG